MNNPQIHTENYQNGEGVKVANKTPEVLRILPHGAGGIHHTKAQWLKKFMDHPFCHYCEKNLPFKEATKDHLTPVCRGGSDKITNIVPACRSCNQIKNWRTEEEFVAARATLFTARKKFGGIRKARVGTSLEERCNEPELLKKLVLERERVSWMWRNPPEGRGYWRRIPFPTFEP